MCWFLRAKHASLTFTCCLSDTEIPIHSSSGSDEASTDQRLRRVNISPEPSSRETDTDSYSYSDESSIDDRAEVEAALTAVENELEDTEEALGLWAQGPAALQRDRRVLSTITEHSENRLSRPPSYAQTSSRPVTQYSGTNTGDVTRRSGASGVPTLPSIHIRSSTDPSENRPFTPTGGVRNMVAQFEAKGTVEGATTPTPPGHSRTISAPAGPRSPSPYSSTAFTSTSQTMPSLSSFAPFASTTPGYTASGYGSTTGYGSSIGYGQTSRPSSPAKSRTGSAVSGPRAPSSVTSRTTPSAHTRAQSSTSIFTGTLSRSGAATFTGLTASSTVSATEPQTWSGTMTNTTITPGGSPMRRPRTPPREPLAQVKNIVAAWKKMQPERAKTNSPSVSPSPRRASRRSLTPRNIPSPSDSETRRSVDTTLGQQPQRSYTSLSSGDTQRATAFDTGELGQASEVSYLFCRPTIPTNLMMMYSFFTAHRHRAAMVSQRTCPCTV